MFENIHPGWVPYKEREDKALALFEEALALLRENKKHYFGLVTGDQKFAIVGNLKNKDNEFKIVTMHFENEQTGKTILDLWKLLQDILERNGLIAAIYEGHDFYRSSTPKVRMRGTVGEKGTGMTEAGMFSHCSASKARKKE